MAHLHRMIPELVRRMPVLEPARRAYASAYCRFWDWQHNVETCGDVPIEKMSISAEQKQFVRHYASTHPLLLKDQLELLPIDHKQYRFVDLGSGKGRVLIAALAYPFAAVEGTEIDPALNDVANANFKSYRGPRQCDQANSLCIDIRHYDFRPVPTVYFLYSSFPGPVMQDTLHRLVASLREVPRDTFLVFHNPEGNGPLLDASGVLVPFGEAMETRIWRSIPT